MLAALLISLPVAGTPGPNNIICAAIGARHGARRALPYALGVTVGFPLLLGGVGLGLGSLLRTYPQIQQTAQVLGTGFLVYLSYRIAAAPIVNVARERQKVGGAVRGFWYAVAFQWINPKALSFCFSLIALYTRPQALLLDIALLMVISAGVSIVMTMSWALTGDLLGKLLRTSWQHRLFNVVMALLLLGAALSIFFYQVAPPPAATQG